MEVCDKAGTIERELLHVLTIDGANLPADTAQDKT